MARVDGVDGVTWLHHGGGPRVSWETDPTLISRMFPCGPEAISLECSHTHPAVSNNEGCGQHDGRVMALLIARKATHSVPSMIASRSRPPQSELQYNAEMTLGMKAFLARRTAVSV
jgi:hypothetical protein